MKAFQYPRSVPLASLPTPVQKLERLSEVWEGPSIFVKRDDLTGSGLSGNKVRKLEFSVAEAIDRGADTLITCGGIQSNHARATAVAAVRMGLKPHLVLRGEDVSIGDGNLFIDRLLGCEFTFVTPEVYEHIDETMEEIAGKLRSEGRKPYIIPEGASNEIGTFGYIRAAEEITRQTAESGLSIDTVLVATGSGGTLGGLLLGKKIFGAAFQPVGINVLENPEYFQNRILDNLTKMIDRFSLNVTVAKEEICLIDGYVGEGYAVSRKEELELISEVARLEGLILDPVYTGKTMFGLRDQIRKGRFKPDENVLFIHTGGLFGCFPQKEAFEACWRAAGTLYS